MSPEVLTQTLRCLEDYEFMARTIYPEVPLHVEYAPTGLGRSVAVLLPGLRDWVEHHVDAIRVAQSS